MFRNLDGGGGAAAVDRLEIRSPSGRVDILKAVASRQDVIVAEGEVWSIPPPELEVAEAL
jgi:hypothetical protein